jgi:2-phosphosulfolactate phosphatase
MQRTISVALLPQLLPSDWAQAGSIAVVIDTLRFTSTAAVALAAGATAITVVSDIERAKQLAGSLRGGSRLCGERECVRIAGFDLGNSPAEYTTANVSGRELVFSTTNGTVAVEAALPAREIVLASLLNRSAVSRWLNGAAVHLAADEKSRQVWCLCAGTDGQVAFEDVLTAGAVMDHVVCGNTRWELGNDAGVLALEAWRRVVERPADKPGESAVNAPALVDRLRQAVGGRNLIAAGFADDISAVAQLDSIDIVPRQMSPGRFVRLS